MKLKYTFLLLLFSCLLFSACMNTKKAVNFYGINNSEFVEKVQDLEPVIQANDILSISVTSLNPEASQIFNTLNTNTTPITTISNAMTQASGYLVDQEGLIQFPYLGSIKAAGLTKKALKEGIAKELYNRKLLIDPIVNVRYLNYKVSVLGEVAKPSVLVVPNEKITLLEALGLAGDLTLFANRENVMIIREENGKKKVTRLNLTTDELFTSPYYYLRSNDIVYVEPNKTRIESVSPVRQWLPVILSGLTLALFSIERLIR